MKCTCDILCVNISLSFDQSWSLTLPSNTAKLSLPSGDWIRRNSLCFIYCLLSFSVISIPTLAYDLSIVLHVKNRFAMQVHWRTTFDYIQRSPTNVSFAMKFSCVMTLLFGMNFATLVQNLLSVTFARLHLHLRTTLNVTCASTWVIKQWVVQLVEENAVIITVWDGTWQPIQVCVLNSRHCS